MTGVAYTSVDGLDVTLDGSTLRLRLDRPDKRNAISEVMLVGLVDAMTRASTDERVRVIVLDGAGDHFCGGADIVARNAGDGPKPSAGSIQRRVPTQAHRLIPLVRTVQVPVVCRVQGWAAGIGFQLALAADFCVAANDARFWEPFTKRGFTPDSGGTWLLPRLVGVARAKELLMLGRELSGAEAAEWGLIYRAAERDDVDQAADDVVAQLAAGPTVALGLTKWLVHRGTARVFDEHLADEGFAMELSSRAEDFREGISAMAEKRDPRFTGR